MEDEEMKLLRWKAAGSTTSDEPLPHSIAELRATLIRLTAKDRIRMNILCRILESAIMGHHAQLCSYLANTSPKNKQIFNEALKEHDLVLWDPVNSVELQLL